MDRDRLVWFLADCVRDGRQARLRAYLGIVEADWGQEQTNLAPNHSFGFTAGSDNLEGPMR